MAKDISIEEIRDMAPHRARHYVEAFKAEGKWDQLPKEFRDAFSQAANENNFVEGIVDPGAEDRRNAQTEADESKISWDELELPTEEDLTIDPDSFTDFQTFGGGAPLDLTASRSELWDPSEMGPSAYSDLEYIDPEINEAGRNYSLDALNYLDNLVLNGGHDAVSDAKYEARRADAEQAARAQREAAIQDAREQGMYSGTGGLMAELSAASDLSRDAHSGALEAEALAQARRDSAANSVGTLGTSLYGHDADIGLRAAEDANQFGLDTAAGQDDWQSVMGDWYQTHGQDSAGLMENQQTSNWDRRNEVSDANIEQDNKVAWANTGVPMQMFNNDVTKLEGKTGASTTARDTYLDNAENAVSIPAKIWDGAKDIASGVATADAYLKKKKGGAK